MAAFFAGFSLSFSLILAIGAQNAFVLRQGILGQHVFAVVLVCCVSEVVLISIGVSSFALIAESLPWLVPSFKVLGAIFLLLYGGRSFVAAWRGGAALHTEGDAEGLRASVLTVMAMTWLNPHCYLDTVVLIGSISTQYDTPWVFWRGGYGRLHLVFCRVGIWRVIATTFVC